MLHLVPILSLLTSAEDKGAMLAAPQEGGNIKKKQL